MGHPQHTAAEVRFAQGQGLWRLRADWRQTLTRRPDSFEAWMLMLDANVSVGLARVRERL